MDIVTLKALIEKLKAIDLKSISYEDLKKDIATLGKFGVIESTLHKDYEIIRGCPNDSLFESFSSVARISYKPQELNSSYQRASTPYQTMFYGCSQQFDNPSKINSIGRITALIESMPIFVDKISKYIRKITFGRWRVIDDIKLIAICYKKEFITKVPHMELMFNSYQEFLKTYPEIKEESILVSEFLANEFSKEINSSESYKYMISAIFSELIINKGFDGVLYPSMRIAGDGMNFSITPKAVKRALKCEVVGECFIFKNKEKISVLDAETVLLKKEQGNFSLPRFEKNFFDHKDFREKIIEFDLWEEVNKIT